MVAAFLQGRAQTLVPIFGMLRRETAWLDCLEFQSLKGSACLRTDLLLDLKDDVLLRRHRHTVPLGWT